MSDLADAVLPLIRTRADLYRWSTANAHGKQMHDAVDILKVAVETDDPAVVFAVTQKAIASALKVIVRADDSSGIIGDAIVQLLHLHAAVATKAKPPVAKLVAWMIKFQFDEEVDYFTIDPAAYAPALGEKGMALYRAKLDEVAARLGPEPAETEPWSQPHSHERFVLEWNAKRLAVHDRDIDAIIRTHSRDRKVAAWLEDTAEALAEIGEYDLAIDWARQATDFDRGHQSAKAAEYWCKLLAERRPDEHLAARIEVFHRWPNASTAAHLHTAAGDTWPALLGDVIERLAPNPRDAVLFVLLTLKDPEFAWNLAHQLALTDSDTWSRLVKDYEKIDPIAVLPIVTNLVTDELQNTGAQHYQIAAPPTEEDAPARSRNERRISRRHLHRRTARNPPPTTTTTVGIRPRTTPLTARNKPSRCSSKVHQQGHSSPGPADRKHRQDKAKRLPPNPMPRVGTKSRSFKPRHPDQRKLGRSHAIGLMVVPAIPT